MRVSGLTGAGLDDLLGRIDAAMPVDPVLHLHFELPLKDGRAIALVHALGRVLHSEVRDSIMAMEAELPESVARRLKINPEASCARSECDFKCGTFSLHWSMSVPRKLLQKSPESMRFERDLSRPVKRRQTVENAVEIENG